VKRTLAWLAGIVGIAALGRWLAQRRQQPETVAEPLPTEADPAEELRQRLEEQRRSEPEPDVEPAVDAEPATVDETLEERRARVHAKAREAIESMDDGDEGPAA
jgi:hypothetical protein